MSDPTLEITVSQSAELSQALDEIFGLTQDGSSTGQKFQKANDKMEKLEKRLTGEQQANIEALNKKEERPAPDFSHGWGLQEMSLKQLESWNHRNKNPKKSERKPTKQENRKRLMRKQDWKKCWRVNGKTDHISAKDYSLWNKPVAPPTPLGFPLMNLCRDLLKQDSFKFSHPMKR